MFTTPARRATHQHQQPQPSAKPPSLAVLNLAADTEEARATRARIEASFKPTPAKRATFPVRAGD